jgi:hypothetical protein
VLVSTVADALADAEDGVVTRIAERVDVPAELGRDAGKEGEPLSVEIGHLRLSSRAAAT